MLHRITRLLRHRWTADARHSISESAMQRITQRVATSEVLHSGEIRICIEAGLPSTYLLGRLDTPALVRQRAVDLFSELRVWDTEHNNGVLIYLLLAERSIELVADRGIDRQVSPQLWQALVQRLGDTLHQGQWEEGISQAIGDVSALLVQYFPLTNSRHNPNELVDTPTIV